MQTLSSGLIISSGELYSFKRLENNVEISNRRVFRLEREFKDRGYKVITNSNVNRGVDLLIIDKFSGKIVEVIESTNYARKKEFMKDDKVQRYISSLNFYDDLPDVKKTLYVSFFENLYNPHVSEQTITRLHQSNIEVIVVGFQD